MEFSFLWATDSDLAVGIDDRGETVGQATRFIPAEGETRLCFLKLPPEAAVLSEDFNGLEAAEEILEHLTEIANASEPDDPAMHRTDTVDYVVVLDGEVYLEVDDQQGTTLKAGDIAVQNGTRHAWRNRSDKPVSLVIVLVGARRMVG